MQGRRRHPLRPGEGRRDDPAEHGDDALLRPDRRARRRPGRGAAARRRGLLQPDHRRRPDEHQRHRAPAGSGASGEPLPEGLLDAVLLQLAIEIVADGEGATRVGRAGVTRRRRRPARGRAGRAGDRQLAAGQDGALSAATPTGAGSPRRPGWRWPAPTSTRSAPMRSTPASSAQTSTEAEIALRLSRGDARAHVYFSDLGHEYVTHRTRSTRHDRARPAVRAAATSVDTLLEALPYIREFHGRTVGDQVRRRGDARRGAARGLRHRRRPAQVRRPQPGRRPRRRPGDHPLHGAARPRGAASTRGCGSPTPRRSRWRRWSCSASSTRKSSSG